MPERTSYEPGTPSWVDLGTSDPDASRAFYGELFGWTAEHGDEEKYGGYIMFSKDGQMVGGCMRNDGSDGAPDVWTVYLASDDAAATTREIAGRHSTLPCRLQKAWG